MNRQTLLDVIQNSRNLAEVQTGHALRRCGALLRESGEYESALFGYGLTASIIERSVGDIFRSTLSTWNNPDARPNHLTNGIKALHMVNLFSGPVDSGKWRDISRCQLQITRGEVVACTKNNVPVAGAGAGSFELISDIWDFQFDPSELSGPKEWRLKLNQRIRQRRNELMHGVKLSNEVDWPAGECIEDITWFREFFDLWCLQLEEKVRTL